MNPKFFCKKVILFFIFCSFFASCGAEEKRATVLVSIYPYRYFVEKIAGDTVIVDVVVPAGVTSHSFEPTPKQMMSWAKADIWFVFGETFEPKLQKVLQNSNPSLQVVDLKKEVQLIEPAHTHKNGCCMGSYDPHIWLSPKEAKVQARTIYDALVALYPEHARDYKKNLNEFQKELDHIDKEIKEKLKGKNNLIILVSHPAYGYLARDYGFQQISVEFEGREPAPRQLTELMSIIRNNHIQTVFIQPQHFSKGAKLIADHLGLKVITLDPYSEEYLLNLEKIAEAFSESQRNQKDN